MSSMQQPSDEAVVPMPVVVAADVQDALLVVLHDLQRLEGLLDHATQNLIERFDEVNGRLGEQATPALEAARQSLRLAVTELQFHDMATQLIWHTTKVLQSCAFRLAAESMGQEDGEEAASFVEMAPDRPNPVTQSEMDAGSIDLF